jgi:hypothetical protein
LANVLVTFLVAVTKYLTEQCRGGKIYSAQFQEFSLWLSGPHVLGQKMMVVGGCGDTYSPHGRQEVKLQTGRGLGQDSPKDLSPVIYFLQLGLTS